MRTSKSGRGICSGATSVRFCREGLWQVRVFAAIKRLDPVLQTGCTLLSDLPFDVVHGSFTNLCSIAPRSKHRRARIRFGPRRRPAAPSRLTSLSSCELVRSTRPGGDLLGLSPPGNSVVARVRVWCKYFDVDTTQKGRQELGRDLAPQTWEQQAYDRSYNSTRLRNEHDRTAVVTAGDGVSQPCAHQPCWPGQPCELITSAYERSLEEGASRSLSVPSSALA